MSFGLELFPVLICFHATKNCTKPAAYVCVFSLPPSICLHFFFNLVCLLFCLSICLPACLSPPSLQLTVESLPGTLCCVDRTLDCDGCSDIPLAAREPAGGRSDGGPAGGRVRGIPDFAAGAAPFRGCGCRPTLDASSLGGAALRLPGPGMEVAPYDDGWTNKKKYSNSAAQGSKIQA